MKTSNLLSGLLLVLVTGGWSACSSDRTPADLCNHQLYYTAPASLWEETLPLGNGRLGLMPDGGIHREHIVLNEISLWSGSESDYCNPDAAKSLPRIRQLLFEGKNREAQALMYSSFVPKKQETDGRYGSYQYLGDLHIDYLYKDTADTVSDYRRSLSLRDAVAATTFSKGKVVYQREYFTSRDRDVMLVHLTASEAEALNFTASLSRAERAEVTTDGHTLLLTGMLDSGNPNREGMRFRTAMQLVAPEGEIAVSDKGITLTNGREAWLLLSAATSYEAEGTDFPGRRYTAFCDSLLAGAVAALSIEPAQRLKEEHTAAHRELYDRVALTLPASPDDKLPTNERILRFVDSDAPALAALYYNYGRYLLISSTRPGSLPPNLQGLWSNTPVAPWNGDYHTNINLQMNHWPLEQAALQELNRPLIRMTERLVPSGTQSARCFYGDKAEGWVVHMMTNLWNFTAPGEHPSWGATNTGGAWLCDHLWEHYLYTQDVDLLRSVYPLMKGAAEFFRSTMVSEPSHDWLVTAPTSSPENEFFVPGDTLTPVSICMGPTMDVQLLTELYTNVIAAARILGVDADYAARLEADLKRFPPMQISGEGYLQEWLEDYREVDVHHRHVSHLYGLHPSNQISPIRTPELAEACRVTLNRRGDEATGWSRAWKMNFWARLHDGNRAYKLFKSLLHPAIHAETGRHGSGTFPNLFCSHPPFQIDGNYGGAAGVGEMLLQSHDGFIHLLPALPDSWHTGTVRGFRVRGGATIDFEWEENKASAALLTALADNTFLIKLPAGCSKAQVKTGKEFHEYTTDTFSIPLKQGEEAKIYFF